MHNCLSEPQQRPKLHSTRFEVPPKSHSEKKLATPQLKHSMLSESPLLLSTEPGNILAICVVTTIVLVLLGWITWLLRRSPLSPIQSALFALNYLIARILWRAQISGPFPIPPGQGAVIICNHRCPLDPSFIAMTVPRPVHWMVAKEYCEHPAFGPLLRKCEVIPTSRGGADMAAIRTAIRLVENGELVGVFPEGRINTTAEMLLPGRSGAAMIALKTNAPVVPCYIHGAPYDETTLGCLLMPAHVRLVIGEPIKLTADVDGEDRRQTLRRLTRALLKEIARLGGQPDYEPKLVGHNQTLNE